MKSDSFDSSTDDQKPLHPIHATLPQRDDRVMMSVILLLITSLIIVIGFAMLTVCLKIQLDETKSGCLTADCAVTAGTMLTYMGLDADPCVDFYAYACAEYVKAAETRPDTAEWSVFSEVRQRVKSLLKHLLQLTGFSLTR